MIGLVISPTVYVVREQRFCHLSFAQTRCLMWRIQLTLASDI